MTAHIATANRLIDGTVVFLGYDGEWTGSVDEARVAERDDDVAELTAEAEASAEVVGAYLIEAEVSSSESAGRTVRPCRYKERIRAYGPSIHQAFAKKAVPEHFDLRNDVSGVFTNGL